MAYFYNAYSVGQLIRAQEERKGFARYVQSQFGGFKEPVYRGVSMTQPLPPHHFFLEELEDDGGEDDNAQVTPRILRDLFDDDDEDLLRGMRNEENNNNTTTNNPQTGCWTAFCFKWRHDNVLR